MSDTRLQINAPAVVAEEVDGEVIAINLSTGAYYSMRDWSAWVWSALTSGAGMDQVRALLPDPDALAPFVQSLTDERLLVPAGEAEKAELAPPPSDAFTGLLLEAHTDMADLILLDPVHDVDPQQGWPRAAAEPQ